MMPLLLHHGVLGLLMQLNLVSDAAFVSATSQAERNLKGHPATLPSSGCQRRIFSGVVE